MIESDEEENDPTEHKPSGGGDQAEDKPKKKVKKSPKILPLARRRGSRPFPKRPELPKTSLLGDDSTEDNDRSSDEDYHLSDEDKPKKRHRGKPSWASKPLGPVKKPEYAVDRFMNGLAQGKNAQNPQSSENVSAGGTSNGVPTQPAANVTNQSISTSNNSNTSATAQPAAQNGGKSGTTRPARPPRPPPPRGAVRPSRGELSEEDISKVEDLVSFVVQDDV